MFMLFLVDYVYFLIIFNLYFFFWFYFKEICCCDKYFKINWCCLVLYVSNIISMDVFYLGGILFSIIYDMVVMCC